MKILLRCLIFVVFNLFIWGRSALAMPTTIKFLSQIQDVTTFIDGSSPKTPYQILENFYVSLQNPANMIEIDLNTDEQSNQRCVAVSKSSPDRLYDVYVVRYQLIQPGRGPLFPGFRKETLSFNSVAPRGNDRYKDEILANSKNTLTTTELVIDTDLLRSSAATKIQLKLRSNLGAASLVAFKVAQITSRSLETDEVNGYCFRE